MKWSLTTQFCFDLKPIKVWEKRLFDEGIKVPINIGVAGPAPRLPPRQRTGPNVLAEIEGSAQSTFDRLLKEGHQLRAPISTSLFFLDP